MFVVIGTVTADLLVKYDKPLDELGGDGFRSSNLVFTETPLTISMGGNGGNSAYVLAGLGAPTALCGALGHDVLGNVLVELLEARGVNLEGLIRHTAYATSSSTILMQDAANQVVFHHLGCTRQAAFEDMPAKLFDQAKALLISGFPLMSRLRTSGFADALACVHAHGGITALDVGPAVGEPVTLVEIARLLPNIDYLIANTHELVSLTQASDWTTAVRQLLTAGATCVVVKHGEAGASVWSAVDPVYVSGFKVDANVSVGAGDSFNAGLLYGLRQGWSMQPTVRFANAVAALVVSSARGVLDSPSLTQVEAFLRAND